MIENREVANLSKKTQNILQKSVANVSVKFVNINIDKLIDNEQFILEFGEHNIAIQKESLDIRGINNFAFVGKNHENESSIILSVFENDIHGVISTETAVYQIETYENGIYYG